VLIRRVEKAEKGRQVEKIGDKLDKTRAPFKGLHSDSFRRNEETRPGWIGREKHRWDNETH